MVDFVKDRAADAADFFDALLDDFSGDSPTVRPPAAAAVTDNNNDTTTNEEEEGRRRRRAAASQRKGGGGPARPLIAAGLFLIALVLMRRIGMRPVARVF